MATFSDWFESDFRAPDEGLEQAIWRFKNDLGRVYATTIGFTTVYYALRGARVKPETARKIEAFTGGAVCAASLVMGPTRSVVKAGGEAA
jgi:hypothetical protein